jgi:FkbM family methyltransferase
MFPRFRPRPTPPAAPAPGSRTRPIGDLTSFLEDVCARGFIPRGVIDVGAHRGDWTRAVAPIFPEAQFILIEPLAEMADDLRRTSADLPRCSYLPHGAGPETGEFFQTVSADLAGSSFLPKPNPAKIDSGQQRPTHVVTLDSIVGERPDFFPDLVKLDVQGFELEVLAGATSLFGRTELFIVETSLFSAARRLPTSHQVIAFMAERGYAVYDVTGFLRRPLDGALGQIDLAFARADGHLRRSLRWAAAT